MGLKENLEESVINVINDFKRKQDLNFEFFVGDDCTGVSCFGDEYHINLTDICHDVFTEQPKGLVIEWRHDSLKYSENQGYLSYKSYCMGDRYKNTLHTVREVD